MKIYLQAVYILYAIYILIYTFSCLDMKNDEQCAARLGQLVSELPEHHRSTLFHLMAHFCRICQLQHGRGYIEPPTILIQVLCHIFVRPPWERIV